MFKRSKPRQFEYKTRFYDERKEDIAQRTAVIASELEEERRVKASGTGGLTKGQLMQEWKRNRVQQSNTQSSKRVFIIALVLTLFVLGYFFYG